MGLLVPIVCEKSWGLDRGVQGMYTTKPDACVDCHNGSYDTISILDSLMVFHSFWSNLIKVWASITNFLSPFAPLGDNVIIHGCDEYNTVFGSELAMYLLCTVRDYIPVTIQWFVLHFRCKYTYDCL